MWFHIDASSGTPIYRQIVYQVRQGVAGGTLRPGDRLPPVRDLAVALAVNPNTIAKAYQDLERDGVIETSRGRGTFVAAKTKKIDAAERLLRLLPIVDRLLAEAYLLDVSEEELQHLVDDRLKERRRARQNE